MMRSKSINTGFARMFASWAVFVPSDLFSHAWRCLPLPNTRATASSRPFGTFCLAQNVPCRSLISPIKSLMIEPTE
jgi:hypothetical protein